MPSSPDITEVPRADAILGAIKINHKAKGYSYHYYFKGMTDLFAASTKINTIATALSYVIPVGSTIFDAFCYRPDSKKESVSWGRGELASQTVNIITPGNGAVAAGYVPNDHKTCLHMDIYTQGWKGREFFRTPPDAYIADNAWVGPGLLTTAINPGDVAQNMTNNPSNVSGQIDGTWLERLVAYYQAVITQCVGEWRYKVAEDGSIDQNVIETSDIRTIRFRRVTSHKMGRAFVP